MKKIFFVLLVFTFLFVSPIAAQTNPERKELQEDRQELQQQRQENIQERCNIAISTIDNIISNYNSNKLRYINRYNILFARLNNLIIHLEEKNIEVNSLSNHVAELQELIKNFSSYMGLSFAKLEESKNFICGESNGQYRAIILEARELLLLARQSAVEINQYLLYTVVPDLRDIKSNL